MDKGWRGRRRTQKAEVCWQQQQQQLSHARQQPTSDTTVSACEATFLSFPSLSQSPSLFMLSWLQQPLITGCVWEREFVRCKTPSTKILLHSKLACLRSIVSHLPLSDAYRITRATDLSAIIGKISSAPRYLLANAISLQGPQRFRPICLRYGYRSCHNPVHRSFFHFCLHPRGRLSLSIDRKRINQWRAKVK